MTSTEKLSNAVYCVFPKKNLYILKLTVVLDHIAVDVNLSRQVNAQQRTVVKGMEVSSQQDSIALCVVSFAPFTTLQVSRFKYLGNGATADGTNAAAGSKNCTSERCLLLPNFSQCKAGDALLKLELKSAGSSHDYFRMAW